MYDFFYLSSYSDLIFLSNLFDFGFPYCIQLNLLNICADSLRRLILQFSFLSIILTTSHMGIWFPFSFHVWSTIPSFSISPGTTAFQCSFSPIFSRWHVSPLYTLPQLQGMYCTHFLVRMNSVGGLTRKRYLRKVEPLEIIVLMSYK